SGWISDSNRVIIAESPIKAGVTVPTRADLLAAFGKAAKTQVTAYTENVSSAPLVANLPAPGKIVATNSTPSVGVTEWKLSNGARVLVKPTDFKADEVLFGAYADGGTSLASNPDYMSASLASQIVGLSGIGQFNLIDLRKKLTGTVADVQPSIGETS